MGFAGKGRFIDSRVRMSDRRERRDAMNIGINADIMEKDCADDVLALFSRRAAQFDFVNA